MTCGSCPYTDGLVYTSMPPKVKCIITGDFHEYAEECNCENARKVKENLDRYAEAKGESKLYSSSVGNDLTVTSAAEAAPIKAIELGSTGIANIFDSLCHSEIGTPCLICGESVAVDFVGSGPKICEDCKQAVLHVKELLKKSKEGVAILD